MPEKIITCIAITHTTIAMISIFPKTVIDPTTSHSSLPLPSAKQPLPGLRKHAPCSWTHRKGTASYTGISCLLRASLGFLTHALARHRYSCYVIVYGFSLRNYHVQSERERKRERQRRGEEGGRGEGESHAFEL